MLLLQTTITLVQSHSEVFAPITYHPLSENYQQSIIAPLRFAASKVKDLTRVGLVAHFYREEKVPASKVVSG